MSQPSHRTVLIVDDDEKIRQLLRRWLENWGYTVEEAPNALEALRVMLVHPPSIMFVDISMPGHDGLWLMERVGTKWPGTVMIMVSGVDDVELVRKSKQAGAIDYVLKPFGRETLHQALARANAAIDTSRSAGSRKSV